MDEAASFELTEVAVEADLTAEEMAKIGFQSLTLDYDLQVSGAYRRLLTALACIALTLLLALALGKNQ
jgi:hypothetical protein